MDHGVDFTAPQRGFGREGALMGDNNKAIDCIQLASDFDRSACLWPHDVKPYDVIVCVQSVAQYMAGAPRIPVRFKGREDAQIGIIAVDDSIKAKPPFKAVAGLGGLGQGDDSALPLSKEPSHQAASRRPGAAVVNADKAVFLLVGNEGNRLDPALAHPVKRVTDLRRLGRHDRNPVDFVW